MWSFGCILYELFVGYPLFPGEDEKEHMALMMEVKGVPPRSVLARATRRKVFFDDDYQPILVPNSKGKVRVPSNKSLKALLACNEPDFVDFIDVSVPRCTTPFRNASSGRPTRASHLRPPSRTPLSPRQSTSSSAYAREAAPPRPSLPRARRPRPKAGARRVRSSLKVTVTTAKKTSVGVTARALPTARSHPSRPPMRRTQPDLTRAIISRFPG